MTLRYFTVIKQLFSAYWDYKNLKIHHIAGKMLEFEKQNNLSSYKLAHPSCPLAPVSVSFYQERKLDE